MRCKSQLISFIIKKMGIVFLVISKVEFSFFVTSHLFNFLAWLIWPRGFALSTCVLWMSSPWMSTPWLWRFGVRFAECWLSNVASSEPLLLLSCSFFSLIFVPLQAPVSYLLLYICIHPPFLSRPVSSPPSHIILPSLHSLLTSAFPPCCVDNTRIR